jgi:hypothetical protein
VSLLPCSPCFPPSRFAFLQEFPELPEIFFFTEPEFFIQVKPVFVRIVPGPVTGDFNGT